LGISCSGIVILLHVKKFKMWTENSNEIISTPFIQF
jgi:hypothetical protein